MPITDTYRRQVALLVRVLPTVAEEPCFALKGGTAINLFIRDMPRLSVDIDLAYVPVEPRPKSLRTIDTAMHAIAARIGELIAGAQISEARNENAITTLYIRVQGVQIKIEVTPVLRGCAYEPELRRVSPAVEQSFGFAEIPVVSFADLYGGKIVAALDRQHPRDFFDIGDLFANEGITDEIRRAFVVYLLSHNRPMHEVLSVRRKPLGDEFARGFDGMTERLVTVDELSATREKLIATVVKKMPDEHKRFLISFERGEADWPLLGLPHVADLPAIKWRQQNLDKLSEEARNDLVARLNEILK